uniref:Antennal ionotropic receptor IR7d.3 n=1 Tax=Dendrolimus punctatus TaxID=238572 RepID=A0A2K8GL82_9NEOP|nr:antennal ionotropic receptor IR7d.3 [Dendrolimus punctatus]
MVILRLIPIFLFNAELQCSLIDSAIDIANSVYKTDQATSVVWWHEDTANITKILKCYDGVVITVSMNYGIDKKLQAIYKSTGFKQTVFIASSIFEYEYFLDMLKKCVIVPIKIILVLTKPGVDISEVTKIAWNNGLSDIVIINEESSGNITISTYFPYDGSDCGNYVPVTMNKDAKIIFPRKYSNFYGCPIKVTLYHFLPYVKIEENNGTVTAIGGIDGDMFMLLIRQINASVIIVRHAKEGNMGSVINGTGTGSFRDLVEGNADILVPAGLVNTGRYLNTQVSHVIETSDVYWCGPNRREIYVWAKVLYHFFSHSAPYLFITSIIFTIVTTILKKIKQPASVSKDGVIFKSFKIFLGQETKFETNSSIINSLYVFWIWFCLIVRIVYQGDLVDGLHKPFLEAPLTTLEESVDRVEGFGGIEAFHELYRGTSLWSRYTVLRLHEVPIYVSKVSDGKRFLIATDQLVLHQLRRVVQVLEIPVTKPHMCYYMRPGWPAAKEMDQLILRLIETGFVDKIFEDFNYEWIKTTEAAKEKQNFKPIDMATLMACFYGLFAFWVVCFVVFIFEIIYFKLTQVKSNK